MTSVKEFRIDDEPTATALGRGAFVFTDDYSVFDWGTMPDEIPGKGAALCTMGAANFESLEDEGIPTHYEGVVVDGETTAVDAAIDVGEQPREMAIELTQVPDLPHNVDGYDYDAYHDAAGENYLIPLEIVFRNTVPVGSSLRKRSAPEDYGLDWETWPDEVVDLPEPVVEFSTKYEEQDRYLSRAEADRIAGRADVDDLESVARAVNDLLNRRAAEAGFVHEDGKIECLYYQGEIRVADVVGTFDENRFSYDGQEVSKEVIRQYHKRTQPEWVEAVGEAKVAASDEGVADWKSLCDRRPESLDQHVIDVAADLYAAGTNAYLDREVFDAPSIEDAIEAARNL
ncbi:Putative phosphoribosylaminoimidazole-succinocarboxamide synthase protein [Halorhabdus tiamatea SARL4B]|uniref:Phosphoribosylaminoimidazole-succinocarboxamide synthase n=1 Tax=Halorhabdus tiamatea SARL4B TaxID=1033806 RepID=F7PQ08_9EURY|nr:phosphoribosylaminoimidazolesuccinocarboxamide synthase [Halorhabdus tiamatea]ERJ07231.1 Putative phosphoribosylaminoimidazole-succinocarboxamide synthase protein [Halorhabdus tiamatea SARL4B]CCQ34144.1 phosphoribosylaminoimidazole-succinocarboxamide synthase [Halorhabdus tiamatea SARL4B]